MIFPAPPPLVHSKKKSWFRHWFYKLFCKMLLVYSSIWSSIIICFIFLFRKRLCPIICCPCHLREKQKSSWKISGFIFYSHMTVVHVIITFVKNFFVRLAKFDLAPVSAFLALHLLPAPCSRFNDREDGNFVAKIPASVGTQEKWNE